MNCYMILPLLLMRISAISANSITKIEIINKTQADVYEIREDAGRNTVAFVNPKAEKPTLREIVYYHMIERPYGENEGPARYDTEEGPEFDDTMRPFTNSHGFPFLETVKKESDDEIGQDSVEEKEEEETFKEETVNEEIPEDEDEYEVVYEVYYDEDLPATNNSNKENKETQTTVAPEVINTMDAESKLDEATTELSPIPGTSKALLIEDEAPITESPVTETSEEPVFEKKAKTARKLLFDRVKERYYSKPEDTQASSTPSERRKREINMKNIPEGPRLPKLSYESLPPYLRKLMPTEKPNTRISSDSDSEEQERLDDLRHKMQKMLAKLNSADSLEEDAPKSRTYGMNLTDESGYIWNDVTKPGVRYNLGASAEAESDEMKQKPRITSDSESEEHERLDDIKHRMHKLVSKLKTSDNSEDETPEPRTYGMNLTAESGYVWNDITNPRIRYTLEASESIEEEIKELLNQNDENDDKSEQHKPEENHKKEQDNANHSYQDDVEKVANASREEDITKDPRIRYTLEALESIEQEIQELLNQIDENDDKSEQHQPEENHKKEQDNASHSHQDDTDKVTNESREDDQNSFEDKGRKRNKHKEEDDTISQLMDSDKFWNWLADWTSVYIDELTDHMIEAIQEEVEKQIKAQAEKKKREEKENTKKPDENKNIPEESDKDKSTPEKINTEAHDKNVSETIKDTVTEKVEETLEVAKPGSDKKDDNSVVDESKENLRRKHKEDKKKKDESPIGDTEPEKNVTTVETKLNKQSSKVEAQNVYGNTIGGEKVTNIFIFYPNQDPNKILQDISKLNGSNGVNIDIRLNDSKTDSKDEVLKKDESSQVSIEKNKDVINEVTTENIKIDISTTELPITTKEPTTELVPETTTIASKTESTTTKSPKVTEESTTELVSITPADAPESTTIQSNQDTTENESTTESSKVESTTEVSKQDNDGTKQSEDKSKDITDSLDEDEKEVENKAVEENEQHETKKNESTTEKSELKDQSEE